MFQNETNKPAKCLTANLKRKLHCQTSFVPSGGRASGNISAKEGPDSTNQTAELGAGTFAYGLLHRATLLYF